MTAQQGLPQGRRADRPRPSSTARSRRPSSPRRPLASKFDATVEVAMRLGVDPRKADQMVRGTVNLPHGTGKTARVIVFATGDKAAEAEAAGADVVGSDDLIARIQGGWLDFDAAIATPDQMAKVGRIARILGPRGLMPNPKTGTVTPDVAKAVSDIKGGKITFRVDKQANLHLVIGKASFTTEQLVENYARRARRDPARQAVRGQGPLPEEGHRHHHDGPGHPGRPEPHPQPAGGRQPVRLSRPPSTRSIAPRRALLGGGVPSSPGCRCGDDGSACPVGQHRLDGLRLGLRPGQRGRRCGENRGAGAAWRRPSAIHDRPARREVRVRRRLAERQHRRHAGVGAVEDRGPLVAGPGRERRPRTAPAARASVDGRPAPGGVAGRGPARRAARRRTAARARRPPSCRRRRRCRCRRTARRRRAGWRPARPPRCPSPVNARGSSASAGSPPSTIAASTTWPGPRAAPRAARRGCRRPAASSRRRSRRRRFSGGTGALARPADRVQRAGERRCS